MNLNTPSAPRDHGGGIDAARAQYGGARADWLDLSTGINPEPYPIQDLPFDAWTALPDRAANAALLTAARQFWQVPDHLDILAAPGASALIAMLPRLFAGQAAYIPEPTYNEHKASFDAHGWDTTNTPRTAKVKVMVHPNNPDGKIWTPQDLDAEAHIIDESFADIMPAQSLLQDMGANDIMLKSFGKFWGLAGLRLGFAIGAPAHIARLNQWRGPWAVSGPALTIGARALNDHDWAANTRSRLRHDAQKLDQLLTTAGATILGGTDLFRLYDVADSAHWQEHLAKHQIWSRIFPYNKRWLRLGLPARDRWAQLEAALHTPI